MLKQSRLKELYSYDKDTGNFTVLVRRGSLKVGAVAGTTCRRDGYKRITIYGKVYLQHRLAFLYVYGEFPPKEIDHIDRDRSNNKISNLRSVTPKDNMKNKSMHKNNTSGVIGVNLDSGGSWCARISHNGERITLGYFKNKEDAIMVRKEAEIKYGYLSGY